MNTTLIPILAAAVIFLFIFGLITLVAQLFDSKRKLIRRRLDKLAGNISPTLSLEVDRNLRMSEVPWLSKLMENTRWAARLSRLVQQSKAPGSPGLYVLLSLLLGFVGFYPVFIYSGDLRSGLGLGLLLAWLPFFWLKKRFNTRMTTFQSQLADVLDLVARSMRAGHTFTGGLRMAVDEFPEPISSELGQTLDEINYGMDMDDALQALLGRVDCPDLKFFVVSVNVQRETGGNLAEIIATIATLIRERFMLHGKIQVLSAEGRISAWILLALPFVITGVLWLMNPEYINVLFTDPIGKNLIWGALISMSFGFIVIKRMIKIKV